MLVGAAAAPRALGWVQQGVAGDADVRPTSV